MKAIGRQIKMIRLMKNLSLKELGELSNVHFARISKFERNIETPGKPTLRKIESALGVVFDHDSKANQEIEDLFAQFLDTLFFDTGNLNFYLMEIKTNEMKYMMNDNYMKVLLIQFIIAVLKVDKETRDQLSDILCKCSFEDKKEKQIYFDYLSLQKYKEKNYVEAIQYCEKALIINENEKINTLVYYRAAILYKELNKLEVARMYADKAKVGFIKMNSHKRYIHSEIILASI